MIDSDFTTGIFAVVILMVLLFVSWGIGGGCVRDDIKRCSQVVCVEPEQHFEDININCIEQCARIELR